MLSTKQSASTSKTIDNLSSSISHVQQSETEVEEHQQNLAQKATILQNQLRPDVEQNELNLIELIKEVEKYKKEYEQGISIIKDNKSNFMNAHSATLEVLGKAGEISVGNKRFNLKGPRTLKCLFCTKIFDNRNLRLHHISMYHWDKCEKQVNISNYH